MKFSIWHKNNVLIKIICSIIGSGHAPSHIRTTLWGYAGEARHVRASPGWRRRNAGLMLRHWLSELPFWRGNLYILSIYVMSNKKCAALRVYKCIGGPLGPPKNVCSLWPHKMCAVLGRTKFVSAVYRQNGSSCPKWYFKIAISYTLILFDTRLCGKGYDIEQSTTV